MSKPNGFVFYRGPSLIDGSPIVGVLIRSSSNSKTGDMVQSYILRADIDPITANRTGADYSICGSCPHRGKANPSKASGLADGRSCYVNLGQGVLQVYKGMASGRYPDAALETLQSALEGRMLRVGTYGDPAAIPANVWETLIGFARGHTAYTHQSGFANAERVQSFAMVSADSLEQAKQAWSTGKRTFRVIPVTQWQATGKASLESNEILCPASAENDRGVTCRECRLCNGSTGKGKSIAIVAHGAGRKHAQGLQHA